MEEKTLAQVARETWLAGTGPLFVEWDRIADAVVAAHESRRWRPISEAHEDWGVCAFINVHEPEPICASTMDDDFEETAKHYGWTHFCRIVLTHEDAARLIAPIPAPPKEGE